MRVWPKTIIIVKFALKFWLDSTSQISKMIFLDPFREDFHFLPKNLRIWEGFWTLKTDFSSTFGIKTPFARVRANKKYAHFNTLTRKTSFLEPLPQESPSFTFPSLSIFMIAIPHQIDLYDVSKAIHICPELMFLILILFTL